MAHNSTQTPQIPRADGQPAKKTTPSPLQPTQATPAQTSGTPQPSRPDRGASATRPAVTSAPPHTQKASQKTSGSNAAGRGKSTADIDEQTGSETLDDVETAGSHFPKRAAGDVEGDADTAAPTADLDSTGGDQIDTADARAPVTSTDKDLR